MNNKEDKYNHIIKKLEDYNKPASKCANNANIRIVYEKMLYHSEKKLHHSQVFQGGPSLVPDFLKMRGS
jgi:hypothetical protein